MMRLTVCVRFFFSGIIRPCTSGFAQILEKNCENGDLQNYKSNSNVNIS